MKLRLAILSLFGSAALFAQVSISSNFPLSAPHGSNLDVQVKINKGAVTNFAKYQMDVPAGIIVSEVDSKTGNFTFENNRAKIVWVSIPSEGEFTLKFKVKIDPSTPPSSYVTQKFFYLENGVKREVEAEPIQFNIGETVVANTPKTSPPKTDPPKVDPPKEVVKTEPPKKDPPKVDPPKTDPPKEVVKTEPPKKDPPKVDPPKVDPPKTEVPAGGVIYKVQLAAGSTDPGKSKYAGAGDVTINKEGGMYKVLVGNCATKEEAIELKNQLATKGFPGFVVAYKDGVRMK